LKTWSRIYYLAGNCRQIKICI